MTPERRLDQLELLIADALQKTDMTAEDIANLTLLVQKQFGELITLNLKQFDELKTGQETIMNYLREKLP